MIDVEQVVLNGHHTLSHPEYKYIIIFVARDLAKNPWPETNKEAYEEDAKSLYAVLTKHVCTMSLMALQKLLVEKGYSDASK